MIEVKFKTETGEIKTKTYETTNEDVNLGSAIVPIAELSKWMKAFFNYEVIGSRKLETSLIRRHVCCLICNQEEGKTWFETQIWYVRVWACEKHNTTEWKKAIGDFTAHPEKYKGRKIKDLYI